MNDWICKILRRFCVRCCPLSVELDGDSILFGFGVATSPRLRMQASRPKWSFVDRNACGLMMLRLIEGYTEPFPGAGADAFPAGPQPPFKDASHTSQIVVIGLGLNDAFLLVPPDIYRQALLQAVEVIRGAGAIPVFTGLVGMPAEHFDAGLIANLAALNQTMHDVALEQGIEHAGWDADFRGDIDTQPDHIHRTQEATDRLTDLLIAAIDRAAKKL